jgi:hypothetical protein
MIDVAKLISDALEKRDVKTSCIEMKVINNEEHLRLAILVDEKEVAWTCMYKDQTEILIGKLQRLVKLMK